MSETPIFTFGYGSRSLPQVLDLLQQYSIEYLIDVRSRPYSRYKREFSRPELRAFFAPGPIRYVDEMHEALGGQPKDPSCYVDGKVVYSIVQRKAWFDRAIDRLETASQAQHRLALMCSEGKPEQCHRSKLIGVALAERGISIMHIDETGALKSQDQILTRLTSGQLNFLGSELRSRKRYEAPEDDDWTE